MRRSLGILLILLLYVTVITPYVLGYPSSWEKVYDKTSTSLAVFDEDRDGIIEIIGNEFMIDNGVVIPTISVS